MNRSGVRAWPGIAKGPAPLLCTFVVALATVLVLVGFSQATAHDFGYCGHNFNQYINSSGDWQIIATGHVIASNGVHYLTHYHSSPSLPDHYRQSVCSY